MSSRRPPRDQWPSLVSIALCLVAGLGNAFGLPLGVTVLLCAVALLLGGYQFYRSLPGQRFDGPQLPPGSGAPAWALRLVRDGSVVLSSPPRLATRSGCDQPLTMHERAYLLVTLESGRPRCPDCGGDLYGGPEGGGSLNVACACGSEFGLAHFWGGCDGSRLGAPGPRDLGDRAGLYGLPPTFTTPPDSPPPPAGGKS